MATSAKHGSPCLEASIQSVELSNPCYVLLSYPICTQLPIVQRAVLWAFA